MKLDERLKRAEHYSNVVEERTLGKAPIVDKTKMLYDFARGCQEEGSDVLMHDDRVVCYSKETNTDTTFIADEDVWPRLIVESREGEEMVKLVHFIKKLNLDSQGNITFVDKDDKEHRL